MPTVNNHSAIHLHGGTQSSERTGITYLTCVPFLDEYHCPITLRVFNENTHIVAIKTSGNVYAFEAVERLNIKAKFWKDLMTDESFSRKDIITIQVLLSAGLAVIYCKLCRDNTHSVFNQARQLFFRMKHIGSSQSEELGRFPLRQERPCSSE